METSKATQESFGGLTDPQHDVWAAFFFDSWTSLVVIIGALAAQRYLGDILQFILLPFLLRHPELTFQQDNVWPVRVVMNRLQACRTLPWLARSPGLFLIEKKIWDAMGRRLQLFRNVADLAQQLKTIWEDHTDQHLGTLPVTPAVNFHPGQRWINALLILWLCNVQTLE